MVYLIGLNVTFSCFLSYLSSTRTLEENVYKIAISLAQRYSVPLWEVYMTHLEFLFTDSG